MASTSHLRRGSRLSCWPERHLPAAVREGVLGKMVASEVENDQAKLEEDIVKGSGRCRL